MVQSQKQTSSKPGRSRWAGNEPELAHCSAEELRALNRGLELLNQPVEGFPGLTWLLPGRRPLLHRNVRVWPHPSREEALLMEPLPGNVSELGWTSLELTCDPMGTAVYYRGWIEISLADGFVDRMQRADPPEGGGSGQMLFGAPLEL